MLSAVFTLDFIVETDVAYGYSRPTKKPIDASSSVLRQFLNTTRKILFSPAAAGH